MSAAPPPEDAFTTTLDSQDMHYLLARLHSLTNALRAHHTNLRAQNDVVVRSGLAIGAALIPVQDGLRREADRKKTVGFPALDVSISANGHEASDDRVSQLP